MGLGIHGGPTVPQLQDGVGPVMKPEMGMWLAMVAGNNGFFHCCTFFPSCFSFQVCFQMMFRKKETKYSMLLVCMTVHYIPYVLYAKGFSTNKNAVELNVIFFFLKIIFLKKNPQNV